MKVKGERKMRYMYYAKSNLDVVFVSDTEPTNKSRLIDEAKKWLEAELGNTVPGRESVRQVEAVEDLSEPWDNVLIYGGKDHEDYCGEQFFEIIQEENKKEEMFGLDDVAGEDTPKEMPEVLVVNGVVYKQEK